jgi:hypothetical protein
MNLHLLIVTSGTNIADSVNLGLVLHKRLHIQGSTLRSPSRSLDYQANLIERYYMLELLIINSTSYLVFPGLNWRSSQR